MASLRRLVGILIALALLAFTSSAWADDDDGEPPKVSGTAAAEIMSSSVLLKGSVDPKDLETTYRFEYGTATTYGFLTPEASAGSSDSRMPVSTTVAGLQGSTTYHFRLVATNSQGTTRGPDRSFVTQAASGSGGGTDPASDPDATQSPAAGGGQATLDPELGSSVVVAPEGDLRVRSPGSSSFKTLQFASALPMGTEIDATEGTLALTSALPSGDTQTGQFGGGRFVIRQGRRGYINLHLRGSYCPRSARMSATISAAARDPRASRRLWGRDHGGRFRTHGRNSHATVRGTRWVVEDSCKGTLTRVTNGSVVVRDNVRHKRLVLRAGERYLARPRR